MKKIKSISEIEDRLSLLYGKNYKDQIGRYDALFNRFQKETSLNSAFVASSSGRVEIIGNHTDHNGGAALACAINLDTVAFFDKTEDGVITVRSEGYPVSVYDTKSKSDVEKGTSTALIKGVCEGLINKGYKVGGFTASVTSNVAGGAGISSSASYELLISEILNFLYNDEKVTEKEKAVISKYDDNVYFGKPCGLLDQSAISFGGITYLDFRNKGDVEAKKVNSTLNGYSLVLIETGGDHKNLTDCYASITEEMKEISEFFGKNRLIEVSEDDFYAKMPEIASKYDGRAIIRAIHFFEENKRVKAAFDSLKTDDIATFLKAVKESGESSYMLLQNCYVPGEKKQLIPEALAISKKYLCGGVNRVHGGGFAGTILNVVKEENAKDFAAKLSEVFGSEHVHVLNVRPYGAIVL